MKLNELAIQGAYVMTPTIHGDERGGFLEYFKSSQLTAALGHPFQVTQGNWSYSDAGVVRGIHTASVPPGQAKYVTCPTGAINDVIVDLRADSPTFGAHEFVRLDANNRQAVYIPEGLGHGFIALKPMTTVMYLCSTEYNPEAEFGVNPFDAELAIDWPTVDDEGRELTHIVSAKDQVAPTLDEVRAQGLLPTTTAVADFHAARRQ